MRGMRFTKVVLAGAAALGLLGVGAGFAVFRTDLMLSTLAVGPLGTEAEADAWMADVARAHGSREAWLGMGEVTLETHGTLDFPPVRLFFGLPLDVREVDLTLTFRPDTHGPYQYVLHTEHGEQRGAVDTRQGRDGTGLMLDSVRHLFEVQWTAPTVSFRRGLPERSGLAGIFVTWGADATPTRRWDQVALWSRGGRVVQMDTTGRDVAPFIVARVDLEGQQRLGPLTLPGSARIRDDEGADVHRWELRTVSRSQADGTAEDTTP